MPPTPVEIDRGTDPVMQLTRDQCRVVADAPGLDQLARRFARQHAIHLPRLLTPDVWALAQRVIAASQVELTTHDALDPPAVNLRLVEPTLVAFFALALNDPTVTRVVQRVTGCGPIGRWIGDFYQMEARSGHRDTWHTDVDGNRLMAITINLSPAPFRGGALSMRDKATGQVLWTFSNQGQGDALLFRIDAALEHWIHDVEGPAPKLAMAGWFQRTPLFWQELPHLCGGPADAVHLSAEAPRAKADPRDDR